jgi:hypothetical protein
MSGERRFKSWNIFDSALNRHSTGHHYWEAKALSDELLGRGEVVRIFSHRDAPLADRFPSAEIVPAFSLNLYNTISSDPAWSTIENFIVHTRTLHSELADLDTSRFRDSLALFPVLKENQLLGVIRWLGALPHAARPKTAICLMPPKDWANQSARLYRTVWKACPSELKQEIALFCRTPQMADMFAKHVGMPARVYPFVASEVAFSIDPPAATQAEPLVISFVGGARRERGDTIIADVVRQTAQVGVRFFIQARGESPGSDISPLAALSAWPHVQLEEGSLEWSEYYSAIAGSVVLLPYKPSSYRWRDSGVYHEAKLFGAPVLVSAGTWMADEVKALGNGLVIETLSADTIVECITRAQRELPALRVAAARARDEFRPTQGVARCVDAIESALSRQAPRD